MTSPDDPRATLRRLYRSLDGFEISRGDERQVARAGGSATYGELQPTATLRLLERLDLQRDDVFFDLGAGIGKVVLLAALSTEVGRAIGVELAPGRFALAERVIAQARRERLPGARRAVMRCADLLTCELDDATVVYTCSTAFSSRFMRKLARRLATLPRLRLLASLQDLDPHPAFEPCEILRLDASWRRATQVHLYRRAR